MTLQAEKISGLPVLPDNSLSLLTTSPDFTRSLAADIDAARSHVHLLYYILACDPVGQTVTDALRRAAARGVACRLLVDAVASRSFLKNRPLLRDLRRAGVQIAAALPAHYVQRRLPRMDLRNHRKLSVIDDAVAYVGSHNLIHPSYHGKRGGPWVDATARLTGPIASALSSLFAEDWAFETEQLLPLPRPTPSLSTQHSELSTIPPSALSPQSSALPSPPQHSLVPIQPVPTGPAQAGATYRRLLLAAVQSAQSRLTLTTPYFVPDEPTLVSLIMAADRGVRVTLLLPAVSDNRLTQAAGRAHFDRLLAAGVHIHHYRPGLLHTKSVTVDDAFALFGSANLDVRSFNLNFELSLVLYGPHATGLLHTLQSSYLADSTPLDPTAWSARPWLRRYADSALSLFSPLL